MNLAQLPVIKEWVLSWLLLSRNKIVVLASVLVDMLFFFLYGLMTRPIFANLTNHTIIIGSLVSQELRVAAGRARPAVVDLLLQEPTKHFTMQFLGLLLVLAVVVFVIYSVFQGINWWMAASITKKTMHWRDYLLKFAKINILWFVLFSIWYCFDAIFDLRRLVIEKSLNQPAAGASIVLNIILGVIIYFVLVSYPLLSAKKSFSKGFRNLKTIIPALILVVIHFVVGSVILQWLIKINAAVMFIVGILILFVLFAWARTYISLIVERKNV